MAWAGCRSGDQSHTGKSCVMTPLNIFKFSAAEITCIATDEKSGLLVASDVLGHVIVWEAYDVENGLGYMGLRRTILKNEITKASQRNLPIVDKLHVDDENSDDDEDLHGETDVLDFYVEEEDGLGDGEQDTSFDPSLIREELVANLDSKVTAILVLGEQCLIWLGTESGDIYLWSIFSDRQSEPVKVSMGNLHMATPKYVTMLHHSIFYKADEEIPAVYAVFVTGQIVVMNACNGDVLAYISGPSHVIDEVDNNNDSEKRNIYPKVVAICVLDGNDNVIPAMDSNRITNFMIANNMFCVDQPQEVTSTRSIFRIFEKPKKSDSSNFKTKSEEVNAAHCREPAKLFILTGRSLCTYDISKFTSPSAKSKQVSEFHNTSGITQSLLTKSVLIAGQFLTYIHEATRAWSPPATCAICVTSDGALLALRLKDIALICQGELLCDVVETPAQLGNGTILANGDCYTVKDGSILYYCSFLRPNHILSKPTLAVRAAQLFTLPPPELQICNRKTSTSKISPLKPARRQSLMTGASAPTSSVPIDVDKLFAKTMLQRQKDDLFGQPITDAAGMEDEELSKMNMQKTNESAATSLKAMMETREALEERGERINRVALKSEQIMDNAEQYGKATKTIANQLKQKNKRWGLF